MLRQFFFTLVMGLAVSFSMAADRPSFVFFLVDDMGYMDIGANNPLHYTLRADADRADTVAQLVSYTSPPITTGWKVDLAEIIHDKFTRNVEVLILTTATTVSVRYILDALQMLSSCAYLMRSGGLDGPVEMEAALVVNNKDDPHFKDNKDMIRVAAPLSEQRSRPLQKCKSHLCVRADMCASVSYHGPPGIDQNAVFHQEVEG